MSSRIMEYPACTSRSLLTEELLHTPSASRLILVPGQSTVQYARQYMVHDIGGALTIQRSRYDDSQLLKPNIRPAPSPRYSSRRPGSDMLSGDLRRPGRRLPTHAKSDLRDLVPIMELCFRQKQITRYEHKISKKARTNRD